MTLVTHISHSADIAPRSLDGAKHRFLVDGDDNFAMHVNATCSGTVISSFIAQNPDDDWNERLAGVALCAQAVKDARSIDGVPHEVFNFNPLTTFSAIEAHKLLNGARLPLDKGLFG